MFAMAAGFAGLALQAAEPVLVPQLDGDWWTVAGDPDLGKFTTSKQQPVDFAIWQAADGSWQLWSCIRNTACGGKTRLFHRWQGAKITDKDWEPMGVRFADYLVVDGEFAPASFLHAAGRAGVPVVARLKGNLPELRAAVQKRFGSQPPTRIYCDGKDRVEI